MSEQDELAGKTKITSFSKPNDKKTFLDFRNLKKEEYIVRRVDEILTKNPYTNAKQLGKMLKVSDATIIKAFDNRTLKEKKDKKAGKINFDEILNILTKTGTKLGIGALGIGVLSNPEKLVKFSEEMLTDLFKNKIIVEIGTFAFVLWQKFIKPKIKDPKNDLSEIEIIIKLIESESFKFVLLVVSLIFVIPIAWTKLYDLIAYIKGTKWDTWVEENFTQEQVAQIVESTIGMNDYVSGTIPLIGKDSLLDILFTNLFSKEDIKTEEEEKEIEEVYGPVYEGGEQIQL